MTIAAGVPVRGVSQLNLSLFNQILFGDGRLIVASGWKW